MKPRFAVFLVVLIVSVTISFARAEPNRPVTLGAELKLDASDFEAGTHQGSVITAAGLTLDEHIFTGEYVSAPIEAPMAFNALVASWSATVPEGSSLIMRLRSTTPGGEWREWTQLEEDNDGAPPDDGSSASQLILVPDDDNTHRQLQFAVSFSRFPGQQAAILEEVDITFIDSTQGPNAAEMVALQAELESSQPESAPEGYPKPPVIGRDVWCIDPACNYTDGLEHVTVSHLIVHHTVSANSSTNWPAIVRAIWYYHTFTRGWGDIGYNFLVDMNGVIYEGHLGGDDVVGTHAAGANEGSLGLALLGTFTLPSQSPPGIEPPPAMLNSAADLLAWKADQRGINVFDAGYLPNIDWGLPRLMGHRDVYGTTQCPGDQAHVLLPWLQQQVANRIGFVSPHMYIDELSTAFTMSNSSGWYTASLGCGFKQHAFYAWSTTNPGAATNWGEWRPTIPESGPYQVEVYAPYCVTGEQETESASYKVTHANGTNWVTVNQDEHVGTWMNLGSYYFNSGNSGVIRLTNLTADNGWGVWFDAIRLKPMNPVAAPTAQNLQPGDFQWLRQRTVNFAWQLVNPLSVNATRLVAATDIGFTNVIYSNQFAGAPTSHSHTFAQDYETVYWRVVLTSVQNQTFVSPIAIFGIDTTAPSSAVLRVVRIDNSHYGLYWAGQDATSGAARYNVDYRADGDSQWLSLVTNAAQTSSGFFPPDNRTYWFRSQAIDHAGNVETLHASGDTNTTQAVQLYRAIMFPLVAR